MVQIINHVEVRRRTRLKQQLEVDFTHGVYNTFARMPWLGEILMTVKAGLGAMLADNVHYLTAACQEERFLHVWTRHHVGASRQGVERLYEYCGSLHPERPYIDRFGALLAADCGDLMRLIGAWVEKHHGTSMDVVKGLERAGAGQHRGPWDQREAIRRREGITSRENSITYGNVTIDWTPLDIRSALLSRGQDKHDDAGGVCGRELKRMPPERVSDSVLKIDRLFGLRDACSISGTTADVMYFLNTFGKKGVNGFRDLGEIYRVLPFGTIAGFHHHSVLEVALPQALRGYIDYTIGRYTTLVPTTADTSSSLVRGLQNTAWIYEQALTQHGLHMICFYDQGFPEGAIVFNKPGELQRFFNSHLANARQLSAVAPSLPTGLMSFDQTMGAIESIDPGFHFWLANRLQMDCSDELVEVHKFSTRLAA